MDCRGAASWGRRRVAGPVNGLGERPRGVTLGAMMMLGALETLGVKMTFGIALMKLASKK